MPPNLRRPLLRAGGFLTDVLGCLYGLGPRAALLRRRRTPASVSSRRMARRSSDPAGRCRHAPGTQRRSPCTFCSAAPTSPSGRSLWRQAYWHAGQC
jgi:hypothetical protein